MNTIDRQSLESIWDKLAPEDFTRAPLSEVRVGDVRFQKLFLPRGDDPSPVMIALGFSLYGIPRFAAYRYRLVLIPEDVVAVQNRWDIREMDIQGFISWSRHVRHVITFSTLKSGGSVPLKIHAQSFPLQSEGGVLSALATVGSELWIPQGVMPRYRSLEIRVLKGYPLRGISITGNAEEMASKLFELALNYDHLKTFNLVILPASKQESEAEVLAFFFPRRKDGRAIYDLNGNRWQIAALETNGLMQAKSEADLASIDESKIREIFECTGLDETEFDEFLQILETF